MFKGIDLYSDTMTKPSKEMKQFMMDAPLGDEQKNEDPTTIKLEKEMAARLGKSSTMFFPSATMCNQIAVYLHCQPGDEIIGAESSHIFNSEAGGAAFHARAQARMIYSQDGTFDGLQLKSVFRAADDPHTPKSSLVLVENTNNAGGGTVWAPQQLSSVIKTAQELNLKTHLDGARLFNASIATGQDLKSLANGFDTITVCFSKGLGCALGAVLAFDEIHWQRIRKLKQVFGGALRQSGMLAAGCLFALENNMEQLAIDHKNAQALAIGLSTIDGLLVENKEVKSNMVFFSLDENRYNSNKFLPLCLEYNIRFSQFEYNRFRGVTHRDITISQIEEVIEKVKQIIPQLRS